MDVKDVGVTRKGKTSVSRKLKSFSSAVKNNMVTNLITQKQYLTRKTD
jgi:hypothetical protein